MFLRRFASVSSFQLAYVQTWRHPPAKVHFSLHRSANSEFTEEQHFQSESELCCACYSFPNNVTMGKYQGRVWWYFFEYSPRFGKHMAQELPEAEGVVLYLIYFLAQIRPTECLKKTQTTNH